MPKSFAVFLTDDASIDLAEIVHYIAEKDSPAKANHVLARIADRVSSLAEQPHRGVHPRELAALGILEYRELFFKPYRILYRVTGEAVYVMLIVDGRRDLQRLLERRLLQG